jgi:hemoglobin
MAYKPAPGDMPFDRVGGEEAVKRLAARFYDHMDAEEPELARLHELDAQGRVSARSRENFALFLVEWLGGPQLYSPVHGHPRLRMRHGKVAVGTAMRDAWLRCMQKAMDDVGVEGDIRTMLDARFAEVADFLRNVPG